MSRSRKHGVFAVSGDAVVISNKQKELWKDDKEIQKALEMIFHQMHIVGNRPRTIESYAYIFQQFVEVYHIEYVEDIT
ncbi:hypothetical protein [Lysinibacillus fusiformis]|uniref:hypothetical protein n=1 Tax=Lysinibacillus fusiformis TaxID=28031 RepID=UPI0020D03D85|nr:hypothetical protein [Lysinibacillus fusiformis]